MSKNDFPDDIIAYYDEEFDELIDYEKDDSMVEGVRNLNIDGDMANVIVKGLSKINIRADMVEDPYGLLSTSTFHDFLLKPELIRATVENGFEHPSEVQQQCIPKSMLGQDTLCQAKSGTGKTAVFVLSTLQQLEPVSGQVSVIVLCHTHELACQIKGEYVRFSKYLPDIRTEVFYGGKPIATDKAILKEKCRCPHVVVGTPGRVKALLEESSLKVENVHHFILDECDRMLESEDMRRDVQKIFKSAPRSKQVLMFSATMDELVRTRCKRYMVEPQEVYIDHETNITLHGLKQYYIEISEAKKNRKLAELLNNLEFNQVCVFVKSVVRAQQLDQLLKDHSFPSVAIHSQMALETRMRHFQEVRDFKKRIVVTTDVLSRGVDVSRINVVINYDCPLDANTYLHRVGRAGRFGTKAVAIAFVSGGDDNAVLKNVQDRLGIKMHDLPDELDVADYMNE